MRKCQCVCLYEVNWLLVLMELKSVYSVSGLPVAIKKAADRTFLTESHKIFKVQPPAAPQFRRDVWMELWWGVPVLTWHPHPGRTLTPVNSTCWPSGLFKRLIKYLTKQAELSGEGGPVFLKLFIFLGVDMTPTKSEKLTWVKPE